MCGPDYLNFEYGFLSRDRSTQSIRAEKSSKPFILQIFFT